MSQKVYKFYRRYLSKYNDFIFVEDIAVFTDLNKAQDLINNEKEDKSSLDLHLDSGVIEFDLNTIYENISRITPMLLVKFHNL